MLVMRHGVHKAEDACMLVHLPGLPFASTVARCGVTETETEASMA